MATEAELKKQIKDSTNKAVRALAKQILPASLEKNSDALNQLTVIVDHIIDAAVAKTKLADHQQSGNSSK